MTLLLALVSGGAACSTDLTQAWEIVGPHVYGSRIEVEGDPTRSMPRWGESFVMRQYIVGADELTEPLAQRYDMKLALCIGFQAPDGSTICAPVDTSSIEMNIPVQTLNANEFLVGPITLPTRESLLGFLDESSRALLDEVDQLALLGAVCVQGTVVRVPGTSPSTNAPPELFRCDSRADSIYKSALTFLTAVYLDLQKDDASTPNHNPSFACDPDPAAAQDACNAGVPLDPTHPADAGAPAPPPVTGAIVLVGPRDKKHPDSPRQVDAWPPYPNPSMLPSVHCADDPLLPKVTLNSGDHNVRVRVDARDRETFTYQAEEYGKEVTKTQREEPFVTIALSQHGGEMERFTSVVSADDSDAEAEISVKYTPPKKNPKGAFAVPADGRLVRFFFTLNDQRGGYDFTTRALCLLPAPPAQ